MSNPSIEENIRVSLENILPATLQQDPSFLLEDDRHKKRPRRYNPPEIYFPRVHVPSYDGFPGQKTFCLIKKSGTPLCGPSARSNPMNRVSEGSHLCPTDPAKHTILRYNNLLTLSHVSAFLHPPVSHHPLQRTRSYPNVIPVLDALFQYNDLYLRIVKSHNILLPPVSPVSIPHKTFLPLLFSWLVDYDKLSLLLKWEVGSHLPVFYRSVSSLLLGHNAAVDSSR